MKPGAAGYSPKIALASVELGRIRRGYERVSADFFEVLRDDLDITIYKGAGETGTQEKVPPMLSAATAMARRLPLGNVAGRSEYREYTKDCMAFAVCLLPELLRHRYDVVHTLDFPLARILRYFQRVFGVPARILVTDACALQPKYYPRSAHLHQVAQVHYQEALATGIPKSHMTLIPLALHTQRFVTKASREDLRRKYGISESTFVVLDVTAIRTHKHLEYLIEEVTAVEGDILLWLDGTPDEPELAALAREKLGPRCRITYVPTSDVPELYCVADVLAHACLQEAFGLVLVEALSAGLMVLAHDAPHFEWLLQDRECLVNMRGPGNLSARLRVLAGRGRAFPDRAQERAQNVRRRFDWQAVKPAYIEMYNRVANGSLSTLTGDS